MADWLYDIKFNGTEEVSIMLLGNKVDLGEGKREVSTEEGMRYAKAHNLYFAEISAKENNGNCVSKCFDKIILSIVEQKFENDEEFDFKRFRNTFNSNNFNENMLKGLRKNVEE